MRTEEEITESAEDRRAFSNGTEYEIWADEHCYECVNEDFGDDQRYCPVLSVALRGRWPAEWTRALHVWKVGDKSGSYEVVDTCTEFRQRPDDEGDDEPPPDPVPPFDAEMPGQTDMFGFFADEIVEQVQREPAATP